MGGILIRMASGDPPDGESAATLQHLAGIVRRVFRVPADVPITRDTTAADVNGWDSLSHALVVMEVEKEFRVALPMIEAFNVNDLGEFAGLIVETKSGVARVQGISNLEADGKLLVIAGDAQAQALALGLSAFGTKSGKFSVLYEAAAGDIARKFGNELERGAIVCEQHGPRGFEFYRPGGAHVSFPPLSFNALWPLNAVNPWNRPEPPEFPFGRFPYGDAFITGCIRGNLAPNQIMRLYLTTEWDATWPVPEAVLEVERDRLKSLDSRCAVTIGSFVLDNLGAKRLFWTPTNPANELLSELAGRILRACGLDAGRDARVQLPFAKEVFGTLSVPIHPTVAKRLSLQWCDPAERYNYFDRRTFSYSEYFENLVTAAFQAERAAKGAVRR